MQSAAPGNEGLTTDRYVYNYAAHDVKSPNDEALTAGLHVLFLVPASAAGLRRFTAPIGVGTETAWFLIRRLKKVLDKHSRSCFAILHWESLTLLASRNAC
jgi:hypothetical protein